VSKRTSVVETELGVETGTSLKSNLLKIYPDKSEHQTLLWHSTSQSMVVPYDAHVLFTPIFYHLREVSAVVSLDSNFIESKIIFLLMSVSESEIDSTQSSEDLVALDTSKRILSSPILLLMTFFQEMQAQGKKEFQS
jgi:hypothetical protein